MRPLNPPPFVPVQKHLRVPLFPWLWEARVLIPHQRGPGLHILDGIVLLKHLLRADPSQSPATEVLGIAGGFPKLQGKAASVPVN